MQKQCKTKTLRYYKLPTAQIKPVAPRPIMSDGDYNTFVKLWPW